MSNVAKLPTEKKEESDQLKGIAQQLTTYVENGEIAKLLIFAEDVDGNGIHMAHQSLACSILGYAQSQINYKMLTLAQYMDETGEVIGLPEVEE